MGLPKLPLSLSTSHVQSAAVGKRMMPAPFYRGPAVCQAVFWVLGIQSERGQAYLCGFSLLH